MDLRALRSAPSFEAGARTVLEALLSEAEAALGPERLLLRGVLYLRPAGAWQALAVVEREGAGLHDVGASASVWHLLQERRQPLVFAVADGAVLGVGGRSTSIPVSRTLAGLARRRTRTLLALPLLGLGDAVLGAAILELGDEARPGDVEAAAALMAIADPAALVLPALPPVAAPPPGADALVPVVGRVMARNLALVDVFARQSETMLLIGPTGAGKSQLARRCHAISPVADGPFEVSVLSTVPEQLQLPTLFGWRRGAFTGAQADSAGAVARAERGTLFLDEIDKLSLVAQSGLLQFLESRAWRPLGDTGPLREAHVRVIVGTNADLEAAVAEGRFLQDLLFRIDVFPVRIPGLDERRDEIAAWAQLMADRRGAEVGGAGAVRVSAGAGALLAEQAWPGNLRQLDNVVRRACAIASAEAGGASTALEVRHVERALAIGRAPARAAGLIEGLEAAADAFVAEARRRGELPFELLDALPAAALWRAAGAEGDLRAAYALFGRGALVEARSHHKDFRRRVQRLLALYEELGEPAPEALLALQGGD